MNPEESRLLVELHGRANYDADRITRLEERLHEVEGRRNDMKTDEARLLRTKLEELRQEFGERLHEVEGRLNHEVVIQEAEKLADTIMAEKLRDMIVADLCREKGATPAALPINCWYCLDNLASLLLKCGHYLCQRCLGGGRDKCNPIVARKVESGSSKVVQYVWKEV